MDPTFFLELPWSRILAAAGVMLVAVGIWAYLQAKLNPTMGTIDNPDASAYLKGGCGDAMKLSLRLKDGRVVDAKYWTDGCRMSQACGEAAAKLALEKSLEDLVDIDHEDIERMVGYLPEEDRHCATLAAGTLKECVRSYFSGAEISNIEPLKPVSAKIKS